MLSPGLHPGLFGLDPPGPMESGLCRKDKKGHTPCAPTATPSTVVLHLKDLAGWGDWGYRMVG
jgi:hypothetical protein